MRISIEWPMVDPNDCPKLPQSISSLSGLRADLKNRRLRISCERVIIVNCDDSRKWTLRASEKIVRD